VDVFMFGLLLQDFAHNLHVLRLQQNEFIIIAASPHRRIAPITRDHDESEIVSSCCSDFYCKYSWRICSCNGTFLQAQSVGSQNLERRSRDP
jgi:hypothetical protein